MGMYEEILERARDRLQNDPKWAHNVEGLAMNLSYHRFMVQELEDSVGWRVPTDDLLLELFRELLPRPYLNDEAAEEALGEVRSWRELVLNAVYWLILRELEPEFPSDGPVYEDDPY